MSRSNPSEHLPNPSTRWFEWDGAKGEVTYYDKDAKREVPVPLPFTFILLDELASVRGWHDSSNSGIYSNEVRDTTQEVMVVKSFKGGTIAEGLYRAIKDRVNNAGGDYNANCYLAFKDGGDYQIGSVRFKGAALRAWMDFRKAHRGDIYKQAIRIKDYTEGKKGAITFRVPNFTIHAVTPEAEERAVVLDQELQEFLTAYLKKNKRDQAESVSTQPARHISDEEMAGVGAGYAPTDDSDVPF